MVLNRRENVSQGRGAGSGYNVVGIIVVFRPTPQTLTQLLAALLPQVCHVVIVDNGSEGILPEVLAGFSTAVISVLCMGCNKGVAAGLNRGVEAAVALGATHAVLFDQDSLPATDMIARLLYVYEVKQRVGGRVAALGPRYVDNRANNPPPFMRTEGLFLNRLCCSSDNEVHPVDHLITSGSLIPIDAWRAIGGMEERLFIDYVDIEWGLRAMNRGYRCFGVCGARMGHVLGDAPLHFAGMRVPVHSPLRHYYLFRNAIWLYRQPWVRWNWKVVDGARLVLKFGFYSLITAPRFQHFRCMVRGIWHGLLGRMGRLDA